MMATPAGEKTGPGPEQAVRVDSAELQAITQLLALLDKTFKTVRTYGPTNPVAQRFFQQFYSYLTLQLAAHDVLQFLVQRGELYYKGQVVYRSSSPTENLAFKLHADGIRELSFHKGLSQSDLQYFLQAVWDTDDAETADDDIVTRLWEKNLSTISFVTAEEIVNAVDVAAFLTPQDAGTLNSPLSNLRTISQQEARRRQEEQSAAAHGHGPPAYEISEHELQQLAKEIAAESARDRVIYLLDMLTAILASEQSSHLLDRLLALFADVLDTLIKEGDWKLLNTLVSLLREAQELCPNLSDSHKAQLVQLFDSLGRTDRLQSIETVLNASPDSPTDDLHALLLMLDANSTTALCTLMANLKHKTHRMVVCDVLTAHAKQNPTALIKGLRDPRWYVVRNLVSIIGRVGDEQVAKHLEPLRAHGDVRVRKEVLRALRTLPQKTTKAERFIAFLHDSETSIRLLALKTLLSGEFTSSFEAWAPIVTVPSFHDRSVAEKKAVFQAMRQTAGEANVPYWRHLVSRRAWRNRKKYEEAAVLAAEALGALKTPAAVAALRLGQRRFNRAIRHACSQAIARIQVSMSEGASCP